MIKLSSTLLFTSLVSFLVLSLVLFPCLSFATSEQTIANTPVFKSEAAQQLQKASSGSSNNFVSTYNINLDKFLADELEGFSTFLLTNALNQELVLIRSSESYLLLDQYFSVISSQYSMHSELSASQLQQMLQRFFKQQSVSVGIEFNAINLQISVTRKTSAYASLFISVFALVFLLIVSALCCARRQYLQRCLLKYSQQRNADAWLKIYQKASFAPYLLKRKWLNQARYWQRMQLESAQCSQQAKTHFKNGDISTAKVLANKALTSNAANKQANTLLKQITDLDHSAAALLNNEQWLRDKIAKAMNNYRQKQPLKALRQLYQARHLAKSVKALKEQAKEIKALINNINQECAIECTTLVINCSQDASTVLLFQNQSLHLGRRPHITDHALFSPQQSVFYINHKLVSRAGKQACITQTNKGFIFTDLGSKNGSYIKAHKCDDPQGVLLNDGDLIQLGSPNSTAAVGLNIALNKARDLLHISFEGPIPSLVDKKELNRIWPDNIATLSSRIVCVKRQCVLVYDLACCHISVVSLSQTQDGSALNKQCVNLCLITLGERATISPLQADVKIDNESLLGEVPLALPCNIAYAGVVFDFSSYDSKNYGSTKMPVPDSLSLDSTVSLNKLPGNGT